VDAPERDGLSEQSAGADNAIKIWNVETGEQHRTIQNYSKQVTAIRFIGTGDNIVSCSGDKSVKFHRANDGGNYRGFGGATDFVYAVAALRDESLVVAGGEDGVLRVWNGTNAQVLFNFEPPKPADNQQAAR
jgi:WD40 repeat protein